MKVILNSQDVCWEQTRGIGYSIINLYRTLIGRKVNEYALVFCDKEGKRENNTYINRYFGDLDVRIHECRAIHYGQAIFNDIYRNKSFLDYFDLKADVVHFPFSHGVPRNIGAGLVTTVHDLFPVIFPEYYPDRFTAEFILGLMSMLAVDSIVITVSEYTKNELCYYTPVLPERVFVIPHGYNKEDCYPQIDDTVLSKYMIRQPYYLYFGAADERKNIYRIINAHKLIYEKHPDVKLVIAGNIEAGFKELTDCIQAAKESGRVICTGYVSIDERRTLLSGATALLFPSLAEGFGLPILEAMACGTPVITSNTTSMPEVAGDAGLLVDPFSLEQLTYEMERILTSESLRKELIIKGFKNCERYSWDITAQMTEKVYEIAANS